MRKEKLAWWEKNVHHVNADLHVRATGAEGNNYESLAACVNFQGRDYIFFADIKNVGFKQISHAHKEKIK